MTISKEVKEIVTTEVDERRRQLKSQLSNALGKIAEAEIEIAKYAAVKADTEKKLAALAAAYPEPKVAIEEV